MSKKEAEVPSLLGAHPSSRVVRKIKDLAVDKFPDVTVALDLFTDPENVKKLSEKNLVTQINSHSSLEKILEYKLIHVSQDEALENYTEISVKTSYSLTAALIRRIQYGTYRLVIE